MSYHYGVAEVRRCPSCSRAHDDDLRSSAQTVQSKSRRHTNATATPNYAGNN